MVESMCTERISVIVPIYCVERYLTRCIDSIRQQTYTNLEIILVDDGSPDGCGQMCDDYARIDKRIKVIHKENGGLGYARNSGLEVITGDYVTFIDSDDWISETHIENLYREIVKNQADIVIGGHTMADDSGPQIVRRCTLEKTIYTGEAITEKILLPLIGADLNCPKDVQLEASSCMNLYAVAVIRKHALKFVSERDTVSEDLFFNIDFLYHARTVSVSDEVGYYYYRNGTSISRKYHPQRFMRTVRFCYLLRHKLNEYGYVEQAEIRIKRSCFQKLRVAIRHIVNAEMPKKSKICEIRKILQHDITKSVLEEFPMGAYIPVMRLLIALMMKKSATGVYCLMKVREGIGRKGVMKKILKDAGIGR